MRAAQVEQGVGLAVRRQRKHAIAGAVPRDHVQGTGADGAGGAEDREVHRLSRSAATGRTAVALSMRSMMPPWPGRSAPLSLTPAWRFAADSNRSPTMLIAVSRTAEIANASHPTVPSRNVPQMIA